MGRRRSETGAGVTGFLCGLALVWGWALTTPAWSSTVEVEFASWTLSALDRDVAGALWPVFLLLGGMIGGTLGWIVLVERRRPERPRFQRQPMSRAVPGVVACLSMQLFSQMAAGSWRGHQQDVVIGEPVSGTGPRMMEITNSGFPLEAAGGVTLALTWYLAVYGAVRFLFWLRGDEPMSPEDAPPLPDPAWDARWRNALLRAEDRPLFRDDPDPVR